MSNERLDLAMHLLKNPPIPLNYDYQIQSAVDYSMRRLKSRFYPERAPVSQTMKELIRVLQTHYPDGQFVEKEQIIPHSRTFQKAVPNLIYECVKSHMRRWRNNPRVLWMKQKRGGREVRVFALNLNYVDPSQQ